MRHPLLVCGLVVILTVPGFAASSAPVQFTLTFNKPVQIIGMDGVVRILRVTGTIGGVEIIGEYVEDGWRVGPKVSPTTTFASGRLSCSGSRCTFTIATLLDQETSIHGGSFTVGHSIAGPIPAFATRWAWVSAVARWADSHVDPSLRDKIVFQAGAEAGSGQ